MSQVSSLMWCSGRTNVLFFYVGMGEYQTKRKCMLYVCMLVIARRVNGGDRSGWMTVWIVWCLTLWVLEGMWIIFFCVPDHHYTYVIPTHRFTTDHLFIFTVYMYS